MSLPHRILVGSVRADHALMNRINGWRPPRWFRVWMVVSTRGGDGWLWFFAGCVVELVGGRVRYQALLSFAIAVAAGVVLFLDVKRRARRRRPRMFAAHPWYSLLPPDQFSFPSGHTITAFAAALALAAFYPGWRLPLLMAAGMVGASRILLGLHFLTDVLAGAAIGAALGLAASDLVKVLAGA